MFLPGLKKNNYTLWKGVRAASLGIFINFILAAIKFLAGYKGNSYALIADAIESFADVISSSLVMVGFIIANKAPDQDHPYGHGKAEPVTSAFIGLTLLGAAVLITIQSIQKMQSPHPIPEPFTLWVLGGVVISKELLSRYILKQSYELHSTSLQSDAWHHRSDAITSAAAFAGITIALIGGHGYENADEWAAILASFIIAFNAYKIISSSIKEIMDSAPSEHLIATIRKLAQEIPGVLGIEKCYLRKMGFEYYVDIHVVVEGKISVYEGHKIAHLVKQKLLDSGLHIKNVLVHIEPFDPEYQSTLNA
jgi:cation diffusion facilitator family transporter